MFAEVMLDLKTQDILTAYDYQIPEDLAGFLKVGMRVVVPFGHQTRVGLITKLKKTSNQSTKSIFEPFDLEPVISKELFHLIDYLETYACLPKSVAVEKVIPNALKIEYSKTIKVIHRDLLKTPLIDLLQSDTQLFKKEWRSFARQFKKAEADQVIEITETIKQKRLLKTEKWYQKTTLQPRTKKQMALYDSLSEPLTLASIQALGFSAGMVKAMVDTGSLCCIEKERMSEFKPQFSQDPKQLTIAQRKAIESITQAIGNYTRFLLKGISASGKTEIFLQVCLALIAQQKQAMIVTIDEALTVQMADYLSPFLKVVVLHNGLSLQQSLDAYRSVQLGHADVLITTPNGIFTPFKQLGLIIADEAQDSVYTDYAKSVQGLDVLLERARFNQVPLVYATATPPVDLYYDATMGKLALLELTEKVIKSNDQMHIVDMKKELESGNLTMLSKTLYDAINQALKNNLQALILANKSGYSAYVMCRSCGYVPVCPKCETTLTYYQEKQKLICSHCGYHTPQVSTCPSCQSHKIKPVGIGIEQVEAHLKHTFPEAVVKRLDAQTTTHKGSYVETIQAFKSHKIDILVGTHLISKGHDFDVPVVGILLIDSMLKAPTYLANEKAYQLIKQTVGRTGRKQSGQSIIQTYQSDHFVLNSLLDETAFYEQELSNRQLGHYPPYYQLVTVVFKSAIQTMAEQAIWHLKQVILARYSQYEIVGPSNYELGATKMMIKTGKRVDLTHLMQYIKKQYEKPSLTVSIIRYDDGI